MGSRYLKNNKTTERIFTEVSGIRDFLEVIEEHGDMTAYMWCEHKEDKTLSYSELCSWVRDAAAGLDKMGLAGKRIGIIGDTSPYWVTIYLAVLAGGGIAVPLDKELAPSEINGFLDTVDVSAVFFSTSLKETYKELYSYNSSRTYVEMGNEIEGCINFMNVLEDGRANDGYEYPEQRDVNEVCEYLFTSGTTGTSKCVMLCEKNIFSVVNSACAAVDFSSEDVVVSVLPIHHTYELACMLAGFLYGMHICINDSLTHLLKNFKTFKPTGLVLVPLFIYTMYKRIWSEAKRTGKDKMLKIGLGASKALTVVGIDKRREIMAQVHENFGGNLKKIVCGGAALNPKMVEFFEALGITICEGFGITECSPLVCVNPYFARKYGSVGPNVPCCQVKIDGTSTNDLGFVEGEIQVKGDNVMIGYYDNDKANAEAFTEDGWFRTGDMGYLDADGYLFITGRLKSVIVLENGKNVFPEEIEEYVSNIELVSECVVVGRSQSMTDKVVLTAIIYPDYSKFDDKVTDETVMRALENEIASMNKKLPTYKQVKGIEVRKTEFEKTTSRKIKRHLVN